MLRSFQDLRDNVLARAEEEIGGTASEFVSLVGQHLDRAYYELLGRRPWLFARAPGPFIIDLEPHIDGYALSWTGPSWTATLSGAPATSLAGWKVRKLAGGVAAFRILEHVAGTNQLTMENPWPEDGGPWVSEPILLYKDEYDLYEIPDVPLAPSAALAAVPGGLAAGTYRYKLALFGEQGGTIASQASGPVVVTDPNVAGQIDVTLPAEANPHVRVRGVYRSADGVNYALVTGIPGRAAAVWRDTLTTPALGGDDEPPALNQTAVVRHIIMVLPKDRHTELDPLEESQLRDSYPAPKQGTYPPFGYARIAQDRIELTEWPTERNQLEVHYTRMGKPLSVSNVSEILVPAPFRWMLADYALGLLLEQKHQARARYWLDRFEASIAILTQEDEKSVKGYAGLRRGIRNEVVR